jgi:hypothetical protein
MGSWRFRLCAIPNQKGMASQAAWLFEHRPSGRLGIWYVAESQIKSLADPMSLAQSFASNVGRMYSSPNMSVGLGLLYRLDPIRVEVNFALPLVGRKGEGWARGLNVGIGLEFL